MEKVKDTVKTIAKWVLWAVTVIPMWIDGNWKYSPKENKLKSTKYENAHANAYDIKDILQMSLKCYTALVVAIMLGITKTGILLTTVMFLWGVTEVWAEWRVRKDTKEKRRATEIH